MIYFTSDPHYWHENAIKHSNRPFKDVNEMNEGLIRNWNDIVRPEDTVYCLGDFSLAYRPVEIVTPRLMGTKYLVPGNHDFCHSYNKKSRDPERRAEWIKKYEENGWIILPEQTTLEIPGVATVNMCHHPYVFTKFDDKYERWRPHDDGRWLICGHVHDAWKFGERMINVGVDVWDMKPVSIEVISKIILGTP